MASTILILILLTATLPTFSFWIWWCWSFIGINLFHFVNKLWDNQSAFFTYCSLSPLFILLFSLRWWTHRPIQAYQRQPLRFFIDIYFSDWTFFRFPLHFHCCGYDRTFSELFAFRYPALLPIDVFFQLHRTFPFPKKEKCIVLSETCFNQKLETSSIHTKNSVNFLWLVPRGLRSLRIYFDKTFLSASIRQSAMFFSPCYLTLVRLFPSCLDLIPR